MRALRALDTLRAGGVPEPLAHGDGDYWLTHAVNALIARVTGSGDDAAEARAAELGGVEFDTFWVCALGALGKGEQAAGRLDRVLANDGTFSALQLQVFRLLVLGGYGPEPSLEALRPALEREPAGTWRSWLAGRDGDLIEGLARLWDGVAPSSNQEGDQDTDPADQARAGLGEAVTELVGRGQGEEGLLLARIRELRRTVESPLNRGADAAEATAVPVGEAVRQALGDPACAVAPRALLGLARGQLLEIVDAATVAAEPKPAAGQAKAHGLSVPVTAAGPDAVKLDQAYQNLTDRFPTSHALPLGIGVAVALVAGIVLLVVGSTGLGVVLLLVALGLGGYAWSRVVNRRRGLQSAEQGRAALDREVDEVQQRMTRADEAAREKARQGAERAEQLRTELQGASDRPLAESLEP